ncbi:aldehyde dehydrogenase [Yeosuana marina]|uniref:aldehyde dehydrogenase n=1 Tax=Yeosuana marina TaxID=1565536 RepID=UPI0030ED7362|tara:strand:+ start:1401 stop:2771 length:1371 start_codon:yes stop_codon:yes gene_type:complete
MFLKLVNNQKTYFLTEETKSLDFRKTMLLRLKSELIKQEEHIIDALYADFKKPKFESVLSETAIVLSELDLTLKKLNAWVKPKRVFPSLLNFPSTDKIYYEPYGTVLVIAPWNYPYQLAILPVIGAIAAGNTVVLKPSELTPNTSKIIETIIQNVFNENYVAIVQGDASVAQELLKQHWDYIFFTGSVKVGKIVAQAAANYLTPTTLELGGKNPCIIDESANIKLAAKRIAWGKFLNAGQTCIAPDYILIHNSVKQEFTKALRDEIELFYSKNPEESEDFARIINTGNFKRLANILDNEHIVIGGETNEDDLFIAPTVVDEPSIDSEVMKDEIFGPILPILSYSNEDDINKIIRTYNKPLSLYVFSNNKTFANKMISTYSFGGGAINDTIVQFANPKLPFGGVGSSGLGAYHGKHTFYTFSHKKPVVKRGTWLDVPMRYAPYRGKTKLAKFFLKYF